MINYNIRYRGPYEYDKFILNIFQYSNAMYDFEHDLTSKGAYTTINELSEVVDGIFDKITQEKGFSDRIYKTLIMLGDE